MSGSQHNPKGFNGTAEFSVEMGDRSFDELVADLDLLAEDVSASLPDALSRAAELVIDGAIPLTPKPDAMRPRQLGRTAKNGRTAGQRHPYQGRPVPHLSAREVWTKSVGVNTRTGVTATVGNKLPQSKAFEWGGSWNPHIARQAPHLLGLKDPNRSKLAPATGRVNIHARHMAAEGFEHQGALIEREMQDVVDALVAKFNGS